MSSLLQICSREITNSGEEPVYRFLFSNLYSPDYEVIAGKQLPLQCHAEVHTDYGGDAVRWGLTHHKETAYDCCMACLDQAKQAGPNQKKCNIWVYCPSETGCHSPDIYQHKHQECWLKYVSSAIPFTKFTTFHSCLVNLIFTIISCSQSPLPPFSFANAGRES